MLVLERDEVDRSAQVGIGPGGGFLLGNFVSFLIPYMCMVNRSSPIESKQTKPGRQALLLLPGLLLQESKVISTHYRKPWYRKFISPGEYFFLSRFLDRGTGRV